MDEQRLRDWAVAIDAAATRAERDVLSAFPYETGVHSVGPRASGPQLAELRRRLPWTPADLLDVCRWVGPVSLPDICNAYLMFDPGQIIDGIYHDDGRPDRIGEPFDEDVDVVVFGSDGGGSLYALPVAGSGPVYRLRECGLESGVYSGSAGFGVVAVAADLDEFLDALLATVTAFAVDGHVTDL